MTVVLAQQARFTEHQHAPVGDITDQPSRTLSPTLIGKMKQKIDSLRDRMIYCRRLDTVEPPFGNLRYHKDLERFTLRSRKKANGQWKLYTLVHNIEKLAHDRARG